MYKTNGLNRLVIATIMLMAAIPAAIQAAPLGDVEISSVDDYVGGSRVSTDRPNTEIKIVELDKNRKPVRSWTGKTDSEGRLTLPRVHALSKTYLQAETSASGDNDFIAPTKLESSMPFTFAATGVVEGEVISIQTVEGEVVAAKKADKLGRVFLPAGLASGSYLLTASHGKNTSVGTLDVQIKPPSVPLPPSESLWLADKLPAFNMNENVRLFGANINPNASELFANCRTLLVSDEMRSVPILACTSNEIVLSKLSNFGIKPGGLFVEVLDTQSGEAAISNPTVAYTAIGKLTHRTVPSGTETHLVVNVQPSTLSGTIRAKVVVGPVRFSNGGSEMAMPLTNGVADFQINTKPESIGTFNISWNLDAPWLFNGGLGAGANKNDSPGKTEAQDDEGWVKFKEGDLTGKKRVISDKDGVLIEEKRYDDKSYAIVKTTTTKAGTTVSTDTTSPGPSEGIVIVVEEVSHFDKEGNQIDGVRKTWKRTKDGKKSLDKTETWDKKWGWK